MSGHSYSHMQDCSAIQHQRWVTASRLLRRQNLSPNILYSISLCMWSFILEGTLQAKYEFTSFYRTVHADFSSAIRFCMHCLVCEKEPAKFGNNRLKFAMLIWHEMVRCYVKEWRDCERGIHKSISADADINSTEDPSSSTNSEFEEYATPPAGRNEIHPYSFKPTVERD